MVTLVSTFSNSFRDLNDALVGNKNTRPEYDEEDDDVFHDSFEQLSDVFDVDSLQPQEEATIKIANLLTKQEKVAAKALSIGESSIAIVALSDLNPAPPAAAPVPSTVSRPASDVLELSWDDIAWGRMIGRGGFSSVHLLSEQSNLGSALSTENCRFVLKRLDEDLLEDEPDMVESAANDIKIEVSILSKLPLHKNVIRLFGVSTGFWETPEHGFIVLEHLSDTLFDRMGRWMRQPNHRTQQRSRIQQIAPGVASAMAFLHRNRVIYRDIKPQNIGFDKDGNIRLFDFGLARFYEKGERKLTGKTGSIRYMAPEVARCQEYGFSADVHSFGILMWEVATLQKAFASAVNTSRLLRQVAHGTSRPNLERIESLGVRGLLADCWDAEPALRPSFEQVSRELDLV